MELGERLLAWCESTGVTLQQLADAAGVTVAAVYQWVGTGKSHTTPKHEHLVRAVARLGITLEQFFGKVPPAKKKREAKAS